MLASAKVRLVVRAAIAGLSAGVAVLVAADNPLDKAVLAAAGSAVVLAALEYFTGLNPNVGK